VAGKGVTVRSARVGREARVWQSYRAELFGFVHRRVNDAAVAEDIVHDVLTRAYAHRRALKDPAKLRPWLFQITRNRLIDHYRSRRPPEHLPGDSMADVSGEGNRAEEELARCLRPLLHELPPKYRRALTLADIDGVTQQEIAAREGLSLSGAKSRVQRARRMLRETLLACCRVELNQRGGIVDYEPVKGCECLESPSAGLRKPGVRPIGPDGGARHRRAI
jgi:RNA polymerase sigma-70 factor (ECF subfamily)